MKIDHLAIWCDDIEKMRTFYMRYFLCSCNSLYENPLKGFSSYFLSFPHGDCRIELMHRACIGEAPSKRGFLKGLAHFDIEVGSREEVNLLVSRLRGDGWEIAGEPRITGDGCYEAVVLDPEGNYVELSAAAGL